MKSLLEAKCCSVEIGLLEQEHQGKEEKEVSDFWESRWISGSTQTKESLQTVAEELGKNGRVTWFRRMRADLWDSEEGIGFWAY